MCQTYINREEVFRRNKKKCLTKKAYCIVHVFSNMPRKQSNWLDVYRIRAARITRVRFARFVVRSILFGSVRSNFFTDEVNVLAQFVNELAQFVNESALKLKKLSHFSKTKLYISYLTTDEHIIYLYVCVVSMAYELN
jgi:hypothetical protein